MRVVDLAVTVLLAINVLAVGLYFFETNANGIQYINLFGAIVTGWAAREVFL